MKIYHIDIVALLIVLSLMGAQLFSLDVGVMQLSAYRILLILSFILLFVFGKNFLYRIKLVRKNKYLKFIAIWLVYSIVHVVLVANIIEWFRGISYLIGGYAISILIFLYVTDLDGFIRVSRFVVIAGFIIGLMALNEILTGNYYYLRDLNLEFYQEYSIRESSINSRIPVVMFGNPNNYALFIYFSIVLTFALYCFESKKINKVVYLFVIVFFASLLVSTQSRSGLLGVIVFFGIMFFLFILRIGVDAILSIIITVSFSIFCIYYFLTSGGFDAFDYLVFDSDVGSDKVRINLILNGFQMLADSYLFGVGLGNIEVGMNNRNLMYTWGITNIHNWWMELLVSSGVIIFILYLNFYAKTLIQMFKLGNKSKTKKKIVINQIGFSFMISFFASAVGPSSLLPSEWFWALFGLIMCIPYLTIQDSNIN